MTTSAASSSFKSRVLFGASAALLALFLGGCASTSQDKITTGSIPKFSKPVDQMDAGEMAQATSSLGKAYEANPKDRDVGINYASALRAAGRNAQALSEMARVLRPGGLLILKIHHLRYYSRRLWAALRRAEIRNAASIARIIISGTVYHLTGSQPKRGLKPREVFQTRWMLNRIFARLGLEVRGELQNSDSNARTPVLLIEKVTSAGMLRSL